jgi:putative hydrolase of the HAD superfamily
VTFALGSPTASQIVPGCDTPAWNPPELRLVCLDIDDTLVDFSTACRRSLEILLGRGDLWPMWERITDDHVAKVVRGDLDYADMHSRRTEEFLAELGVWTDSTGVVRFEARRKEMVRRSWTLFDDVLPCLHWLASAGVRLAAVTNASGAHQREKLATLGLAGYFDDIAIAGEVGVAKPDPVMFHTVCSRFGCEPSEAVHVGDKLRTDAVGARDAGLAGVWLDRAGRDTEAPSGVHILTSLADLPELLVSEFARIGVPVPR